LAISDLSGGYEAHLPSGFYIYLDHDYQNRKNAMFARSRTDARKATVFRQM
jgi:hypothetical protein